MSQTKLKGRQIEIFTTTTDGVVPAPSISTGKFLSDNGTWVNPSFGGLTSIFGIANFDFGKETDFVIYTVNNVNLTNSNLKTFTIIPQETPETSLDDFSLNAISFQIENIIDNVSFDIRALAINNASGIYQVKYNINY